MRSHCISSTSELLCITIGNYSDLLDGELSWLVLSSVSAQVGSIIVLEVRVSN